MNNGRFGESTIGKVLNSRWQGSRDQLCTPACSERSTIMKPRALDGFYNTRMAVLERGNRRFWFDGEKKNATSRPELGAESTTRTSEAEGAMMASRLVRKRGMEPPYAVDQISACILHPIISTVRVGSLFCFLESSFSFISLLLVHY